MQLTSEIHLVGSGRNGLGLSDEYDCNVYLLDGGSELALVDAGSGYRPQRTLEEIERSGFELARIKHVLLTHKHADHAGAADEFRRLTGARVYGTAATAAAVGDADEFDRRLDRARRVGVYPPDYHFPGVTVDSVVGDGETVAVGSLALQVVETPGHCEGHCSFVMQSPSGACLFAGDAVFPGGTILLQPIPDCSITESIASIERLGALEIELLMAGHFAPVVSNGGRHLQQALARIREGKIPPQAL
jgi:glyoxylase-like metal-dependent hydrolase (beta-lactamase superfamily II)